MKLISLLASLFLRTLNATLRARHVNVENIESTPQYIIAFWHEHMLLMLHSKYRKPIMVMSSHSKDGEYMVNLFGWYGVNFVRGSSSRGGSAALRGFIRGAREGKNLVFTPDGPRGPARITKDGLVYAARATGLPIVPVAFAAKKKTRLRSWDRMIVPWPFTKAIFLYGAPIHVPREGDIEEWRQRIENALNAVADEVERMMDSQT